MILLYFHDESDTRLLSVKSSWLVGTSPRPSGLFHHFTPCYCWLNIFHAGFPLKAASVNLFKALNQSLCCYINTLVHLCLFRFLQIRPDPSSDSSWISAETASLLLPVSPYQLLSHVTSGFRHVYIPAVCCSGTSAAAEQLWDQVWAWSGPVSLIRTDPVRSHHSPDPGWRLAAFSGSCSGGSSGFARRRRQKSSDERKVWVLIPDQIRPNWGQDSAQFRNFQIIHIQVCISGQTVGQVWYWCFSGGSLVPSVSWKFQARVSRKSESDRDSKAEDTKFCSWVQAHSPLAASLINA